MTFDAHERSVSEAGPIRLYEFVTGDRREDRIRYTDADETVFYHSPNSIRSEPYAPLAIKAATIKKSGDLRKMEMPLELPRQSEIAALFREYPPSYAVKLHMYDGHFDDRTRGFIPVWTGLVLNCETLGNKAILTCMPAATSIKHPGLRRNYQRQCPLPLYGPDCRAAIQDIEAVVVSTLFNRIIVTLPVGGFPPEDAAYGNGTATWIRPDGRRDLRPILSLVSAEGQATITTFGAVNSEPERVQIRKGCTHTEKACALWHDNILNYGGQLWIPDKNPVGTTAIYL